MVIYSAMAKLRVKATYSFDVETASALDRLAARWNTSKSEALRRLIIQADHLPDAGPAHKIAALERLQKSVSLTKVAAAKWIGDLRSERRASSARSPDRRSLP